VEDLSKVTNIGVNAFAAAQAALSGFRDPIHKDHPKTFIATGNLLPFSYVNPPSHWALGIQKAIMSRFIANASQAFEAEGFQFYFPSLVSKDGGFPDYTEEFLKSGPTHGKVYLELINNKKQEEWDYRFVPFKCPENSFLIVSLGSHLTAHVLIQRPKRQAVIQAMYYNKDEF